MSMTAAPWEASFWAALSKDIDVHFEALAEEVGHLVVVGEEVGDAESSVGGG